MILESTLVIGAAGLVCAAALTAAARALTVKEDPRVSAAEACLPGINCGGCGFAGCCEYAKEIVIREAPIDLCAPGGSDTLHALGKLMGIEVAAGEKKVAFVLCGGTVKEAGRRFVYNGVADCAAAAAVSGGDKRCAYGCLGYGTCARACPVDAIEIKDGLAVVHQHLCIGCGKCTKACPRNIIKMAPASRNFHILCSSKAKGPEVKKACDVGCIGCRLCTKISDAMPVSMDGFLAVLDYGEDVSPEDAKTAEAKCPGKCMHLYEEAVKS